MPYEAESKLGEKMLVCILRKALVTAVTWLTVIGPAAALDKNVTVVEVHHGNSVYIMAKLQNCSEATVTITGALFNMNSSQPLPVTLNVSGQTPQLLVVFTPERMADVWTYTWSSFWKHGHRLSYAPAPYSYSLPFRASVHEVIQGPYGQFSHYSGSQDEEAVDWAMPVGTTVLAARQGTVVALRTDCRSGAPDTRLISECNYVMIKHDDGTYAEYVHLRQGGVLVHLGDKVALLQPIALSGNTGYTSTPHLHFAEFYPLDGNTRRTVPINFSTTSSAVQSQSSL